MRVPNSKTRDKDDDLRKLPNTARPPAVLDIQKVHGDKQVLQFLIDEYDLTMAVFIKLGNTDPDKIWVYQRIASEDLIASVCLSDAENPQAVIERFAYYTYINRQERRSVGRINRNELGTL